MKLTTFDGDPVGTVDGLADGETDGPFEGDTEGPLLGPCEGERLGLNSSNRGIDMKGVGGVGINGGATGDGA